MLPAPDRFEHQIRYMHLAGHLTHVYTEEVQWRCFDSLVQDPAVFTVCRVGVYLILTGHTSVALLASEASFIHFAKIFTRISQVVCWIPTMPQRYEHQIWYIHFADHHTVYLEGVSGRCRLACESPVAVSEKQISAVWLHVCTQLRHSRMNSSPLI